MPKLTQKHLKEVLKYNPETGFFIWLIDCGYGRPQKGDIAGTVTKNQRRYISIKGERYLSSRLAFFYMEGYFPEHDVDHIDRNSLNDRWCNLRHVSRQCNVRNMGKLKTNTSGVTGVSFSEKYRCWHSYIGVNGKRKNIGYFKLKKDAVFARWMAEKKNGFPNCRSDSTAYQYLIELGVI